VLALSLLAAGMASAQSRAPATQAGTRASDKPLQEELGRKLFFDTTLSSPEGQACSSCHAPSTGWRFPDSDVNEAFGVVTGAVDGRFSNRSAPTLSYATFIPKGPPGAHLNLAGKMAPVSELLFIGGMFWDGHAEDLETQAAFPFQHPNEMNNLVHGMGNPAAVVRKVAGGEYAALFRRVYGKDAFSLPTEILFGDICQAIAAYERTPVFAPFSSKYDAYLAGKATLTAEELDGLRLMTGTVDGFPSGEPYRKNAQCIACHGIEDAGAAAHSMWTFFCFSNIGVPRNEANPFYAQTDPVSNPKGFNPLGAGYTDLGLGAFLYPLNDLPPGNMGPGSNGIGDFLAINGTFKAPTLRNVDMRPRPDFVKAYMHNGVFKSLKEVVHFYNTRNLTTVPGEIIDFTRHDPYAGLVGTPLWPRPEVASAESILNAEGFLGIEGGQVGNLGLTEEEEDHLVAFMKTLTDGFFEPGG